MADRPVLRRRGSAPAAAPAPAAKPVVKAKVSVKPPVEEDDEDDDVIEIDDEEEEEEAPVVKKSVKKAAPAPAPVAKKAKAAPVVEEDDEEEEEAAPVVKKSVKVKPVEATVAGAAMLELLENMSTEGSVIVITRNSDNKWTLSNELPSSGKSAGNGLRGKQYWSEVLDPAYQTWDAEWHNLTQDERIKKAKKAGVTWQEDKDPRVNIMRCTEAYRQELGIEKYKPQYRTRSSRAALRG